MDLRRSICRPLFNRFYRPYVLHRIARPSETRFLGHRLLTDPGVFHPVYFLSSRMLAQSLGGMDLRGKRLLDMGTGSGAIAVRAAAAGAAVTACDINPAALALARENLRRNGLPGEVVASDLFSGLAARTFDVICFNIPFYPRDPASPFEAAFFAGRDFSTVRAFAAGCAAALADGGRVLIVFSEDSGRERVLAIFAAAGLAPAAEQVTRKFFERFHIVWFRKEAAPRDRPSAPTADE
jgi:release factor glutamine methyltransferase